MPELRASRLFDMFAYKEKKRKKRREKERKRRKVQKRNKLIMTQISNPVVYLCSTHTHTHRVNKMSPASIQTILIVFVVAKAILTII